MKMKIENLRVNGETAPMGIELKNLTFSWEVTEAVGKRQEKSRLQIAEDEAFKSIVFDSGEKVLSSYAYVPELSSAVKAGQPYFWRVTVTDETGDTAVSAAASFEGGHPAGQWKGVWIGPDFSREILPVLRKTFTLSGEGMKNLSRARLYVCGLGLYEAYLNGKKVGEEYLTPYYTDYRDRVQYQTYDIGLLLEEGENTLDIWLGDGWYKGRYTYLDDGRLREIYGDRYQAIADICITKNDGTSEVIGTDETWRSLKSPVIASNLYDGEIIDPARIDVLKHPEVRSRNLTGVKKAPAPAGRLIPMQGLPVKAHERLSAKLIVTPKKELVLDFGQEITGWAEFFIDEGMKAHHIILSYGEILQDGCFYNDNLRSARALFECYADGEKRYIRPHFTFYGFRYVKVEGMTEEEIQRAAFSAVALYSDLEPIGELSTALPKLNQLISNTKWGQKGNYLDIPTDCPQRDERLGWTGDAEIFSGAASYHMRTDAFFRKYLSDMAYEQGLAGGAVPYVVPDPLSIGREKMGEPAYDPADCPENEGGASAWGDAATIIPWNAYLHSGNTAWLAEEYTNMKQWADFIIRMDEDYCGGKRLWECGFHFGDWLSLDVEGGAEDETHTLGGTDPYFVASAYYMYSTGLTAKAAEILGKEEDASYYRRISSEVRSAMRKKYLTAPGTLSIDTQTAYAMGYRFGLFEADEERAVGERLHALLKKWNMHLATGFLGTAHLCDALTDLGHADDAVTLLLNEDYPSWLYEVNMGATTTWERWNSVLPDGHISGTGMNSLNHYAYGCIVEWIYSSLVGLRLDPDRPAGQHIICAPHISDRIGHAAGRVNFAAGAYESAWTLDGDTVTYEITVPFDGSLTFVPDRELKDIQVNGKPSTMDDLKKNFPAGNYVIRAEV